eukprot:gnl/TRDRNA2_/TRDRNA2_146074_c2_seq1.p1 gnl/TRDRNA2_/TRDRNA2_146074_c2~~gnl/TRDRNA2_/TRDRNA2_146074_c2_seq1.p1  ORF type:complete len:300 (+),score=61.25 gnl/TRDRNA2_/TRDRNA2_146074_c2_seq1:60-902(+)
MELLQQALECAGAEQVEVKWLRLASGRQHHADVPAYEESEELYKWLLQQRREDAEPTLVAGPVKRRPREAAGAAARPPHEPQQAAAEAVSRSNDANGERAAFYICGSWSSWELEEMKDEHDGIVSHIAQVDNDGRALFQICLNKNWGEPPRRYHPQPLPRDAVSTAYCDFHGEDVPAAPGVVVGPDSEEGFGVNWVIAAGSANARFKVRFDPRIPSIRWEPYFDRDERQALRRLVNLGFGVAAAMEAFERAGRNEVLAGSLLLEWRGNEAGSLLAADVGQ